MSKHSAKPLEHKVYRGNRGHHQIEIHIQRLLNDLCSHQNGSLRSHRFLFSKESNAALLYLVALFCRKTRME